VRQPESACQPVSSAHRDPDPFRGRNPTDEGLVLLLRNATYASVIRESGYQDDRFVVARSRVAAAPRHPHFRIV